MLKISGLSKSYSDKNVLSDISFSIDKGTIAAIIGPNGSGKTTLFNIMADIIKADSGVCELNNEPLSQLIGKSFSYLPDESYLPPFFTPRQVFMYINNICTLHLTDNDIENIIKKYNLESFCDKKINTLSLGMTKRVSIAAAMMRKSHLIILDEPTNSIDIQSVILLKDELYRLKSNGAIILISSHILDFVGSISDEVIFIKNGHILKNMSARDNNLEKEYIRLFDLTM